MAQDSATSSAPPKCRCGETDPAKFGRRTKRGKLTWQAQCKACQVEYHRKWRENPEAREKLRALDLASKARYPERVQARWKLNAAIVSGRLVRGVCYAASPECRGTVEGHHHDYSKPLDVTWACRAHHRALDRARRSALSSLRRDEAPTT